MTYKRHKIFASGVHKRKDLKQAVWPPDRVREVFEATMEHSPERIPYTYRHPKNNLPVLGWAEKSDLQIFEEGGRTYLSIVPKEMAQEFVSGLIKVGFDALSIGIGKKKELVHIGITDDPAVTGLGDAFEASTTVPPVYLEEVEFEASELDLQAAFDVSWKWRLQSWMDDVASLFQRMRDREIEQNGIDAADKFLPSYVMDYLKTQLPPDANAEGEAAPVFETTKETPMTAEEKEKMDRLEAENTRLLEEASMRNNADKKTRVTTFCNDHPAIVTPSLRPKVEAFLLSLIDSKPVTFEDDKGAAQETDVFELACELLRTGVKPAVVFESVATKENAPAGGQFEAGKDPVQEALADQYAAAKDK
jgi:hypothetical protein